MIISYFREGEIKNPIFNDELLLPFPMQEMSKMINQDSDSEDPEINNQKETALYTTINERKKVLYDLYYDYWDITFKCLGKSLGINPKVFRQKYIIYTRRDTKINLKYICAPQTPKLISTLNKYAYLYTSIS